MHVYIIYIASLLSPIKKRFIKLHRKRFGFDFICNMLRRLRLLVFFHFFFSLQKLVYVSYLHHFAKAVKLYVYSAIVRLCVRVLFFPFLFFVFSFFTCFLIYCEETFPCFVFHLITFAIWGFFSYKYRTLELLRNCKLILIEWRFFDLL